MLAALTEPACQEDDASIPSTIGPYRITGVLGEGGMGVVYRAVRAGDEQPVALKTVRVPRGGSVAGIRAEIHALLRLQHPSVVRILAEGVEEGLPWYAMELLEGSTLRDYLRDVWRSWDLGHGRGANDATRGAPVHIVAAGSQVTTQAAAAAETQGARAPGRGAASTLIPPVAAGRLRDGLTLMRRLCAPLAYLHGCGVVHRDLKPGNVFIRHGGEPVLVDFGLVSRFSSGVGREALEVGGLLVGTASYMAPEQAMGLLVDARADLYALGVILYEVLTGRVPFSAETMRDLLQRHISERPTPPSSLVTGVPERLDALTLRLLAKKPRDRFGYAEDVAAALAELGAEPTPEIRSTTTFLYRPELAGRDAALARLERSIHKLRDGVGGCVLVGGESGVGKTSLVARAARNATLAHVRVVTGECLPIGIAAGVGVIDPALAPTMAEDAAALDVTGAPLHPFRPLLQAIADRCREGGRATTGELLGPRGKVLAPYAPELLDLPGQREQPEPADLPVEAAHQRLLHDLSETIAAYVDLFGPLLLALDDLQWADELSLSFLASIPPESFARRPILILGTFRSDEVGPGLGELLARPAVERLDLDRLDERTVGAIVGDMLALTKPPKPFVHFLAQQSEGNPFFVAEYLRAAVEEGLLLREDGTWRFADRAARGRPLQPSGDRPSGAISVAPGPPSSSVAPGRPSSPAAAVEPGSGLTSGAPDRAPRGAPGGPNPGDRASPPSAGDSGSDPSLTGDTGAMFESLPLPRSLREIVARRLLGLGEQARDLLEVAAVLGREVDPALLAEATGTTLSASFHALKELALRQVLLPMDDGRHRFAHDKLREIAYAGIPAPRRRELHAATAAAMERRLASSALLALHYGELAHHWTAAEVWPKSIHYLEKAGEQALRGFSNHEAVRFFQQAIVLGARLQEPPGPAQSARWERSLVEAHFGLGEDALVRVHAERALRHCRRPLPSTLVGRILGCLGQVVIRIAQSYVRPRLIGSPVQRALVQEAAYVSQRLLEPAFRDNDPLLGVYCGVRGLNLAERIPPSPPLARGYAFMSMLVGLTPFKRVARSWSERALRIAEELGSGPLIAYCLSRVGCYSVSVARFPEAEAQLRRAAELARKIGDHRQADEGLTLLGIALHANGRFAESAKIAQEEITSGAARGDLQSQGWARCRLAESLTRLGRPADALAALAASKDWVENIAEDTEALWAEAAEALAHLGAGDPEAARLVADRALARAKKRLPVQFYLGAPLAEVTDVYLSLWEQAGGTDRARPLAAAARASVGILAGFARMVQFARPAALRARGAEAWLAGGAARAMRTLRRALAEAERLGMPYEQGRAHLEIGLRAGPADARPHLERATELLAGVGAVADALRAREALANLVG
ncbi:MAG: protein kinase [Polyangiaceae bacterium]|nr:protein kinase [Polyangiaceae bacterium]